MVVEGAAEAGVVTSGLTSLVAGRVVSPPSTFGATADVAAALATGAV